MKKISILGLLILLASVLATAQETDRYVDEHGAVSFETQDSKGNKVTVVIDPKAEFARYVPEDDPNHPSFRGFEVEEGDKNLEEISRAVIIPVYAVADEEYRSGHANWTSDVYQIIETADNAYYRDFAINWVIQGYYNWSSQGGDAENILYDLENDAASLGPGLVMGFTDDSNFDAGGIAFVYPSNPGTGYSVCLDQGSSSTVFALRHEIGHNFGASHDFGAVVCMMNYTYAYSVDYFDATHAALVASHDHWFQ